MMRKTRCEALAEAARLLDQAAVLLAGDNRGADKVSPLYTLAQAAYDATVSVIENLEGGVEIFVHDVEIDAETAGNLAGLLDGQTARQRPELLGEHRKGVVLNPRPDFNP